MKKCYMCQLIKSFDEFHKDKSRYDGLNHRCKDCNRIHRANCYIKNKDKETKKVKEYNQKPETKLRKNQIQRYRTKFDMHYRMRKNISRRIIHAIKDNSKSISTMEYIGCSIEYLKDYLQSKFQNGMTWENYGKWHIDHIRPCASFDLTDIEQQKICFNYKNLQPLWAEDNFKKGCKIIDN